MAARPLKILRKQLEAIVGPGDFRAVKQLEDLLRDVASGALSVRTVTASGDIINSDDLVEVDGTVSVTLPLAGNSVGRRLIVKNVGAGVVTVTAGGVDTIDGATAVSLATTYDVVTIVGVAAGRWSVV